MSIIKYIKHKDCETLDCMKSLLEQYELELENLIKGTGLARVMTKSEINYAKKDLEQHIVCLRKDIENYENS